MKYFNPKSKTESLSKRNKTPIIMQDEKNTIKIKVMQLKLNKISLHVMTLELRV